MDVIPFSPPSITEAEIEQVLDTLRSGWITTGPKTREFEQRFAEKLGAPAALAVNSCTAALGLALRLHGVGPGDEVITTTLTFTSTVNVIEHCGAKPVLVDVLPDTLNIDPAAVELALSPRTKAIIPVHFAGHPVDLAPLRQLCADRGIALIEDAAHALPASYDGLAIGGGDNLACFSFYATKNLATGEGGMLTGTPEMIERARSLSLHGMSRNAWNRYGAKGQWRYDITDAGFKCNMGDLQAALGLAQLERLDAMQQRRGELFDRYDNAFASHPSLETPTRRDGVGHALHLYVLRLREPLATTPGRDQFVEQLRDAGIGVSVHFIPVHLHSYYRDKYGFKPNDFPVAHANFERMLSLPLSPAHTDQQIDRVIDVVLNNVSNSVKKAA